MTKKDRFPFVLVFGVLDLKYLTWLSFDCLPLGKPWGWEKDGDGHRIEPERSAGRIFSRGNTRSLLSVKVSLLFHHADGASNPRRFYYGFTVVRG